MGSDGAMSHLKKPVKPPEFYHRYFALMSVVIGIFTYIANIYLLIDILVIDSKVYEHDSYVGIAILCLICVANVVNCYICYYSSSRFFNAPKNIGIRLIYGLLSLCGFASVILLIECIFWNHFVVFPYEFHGFLTQEDIEKELKNASKTEERIRIEHENDLRQKENAKKKKEEEEKKQKEEKEKDEKDKDKDSEKKDGDEKKDNEKDKDKDKDKKKENDKNVLSAANSQDTEKKESKDNDDDDSDDGGGIVGISSGSKAKSKLSKRERITFEESKRRYEEKKKTKAIILDPKKLEAERKKEEDMKIRNLQLQMDPIDLWLENTQDMTQYNNDGTEKTSKSGGVLVRIHGEDDEEQSRILINGFSHSERKTKYNTSKNYDYGYGYDDYYDYDYGYGGYRSALTNLKKAIPERMKGVHAAEYTPSQPASARLRFIAAKLVTFERTRAIECFIVSMPMVVLTLYLLVYENMRFDTNNFVNGIIWISFSFNLLNISNAVPRWIQANFLFTSAKCRYSAAMKTYDWMNWKRSVLCGIYFVFDIIVRVLPWILFCTIEKYQPKSYWQLPVVTFACELVLVYMATQYWRWFKNNFAPTKDLFAIVGNALLSLFSQYFFFSHRTWNVFCGIEIVARYVASVVLFAEYVEINLREKVRPDDVWGVVYLCILCLHILWGCMWATVRYEWLRDLDKHLKTLQKTVQVARKPNVHSSAITDNIPCSLELFSTSLIPGFIPETVALLRHYRRKEEHLLKQYVENDDARIRELERRKDQHREELERWQESEQKLQEVKLKRAKSLQEQVAKGEMKSSLSKIDKSNFAKDFDTVFRKKVEKDRKDGKYDSKKEKRGSKPKFVVKIGMVTDEKDKKEDDKEKKDDEKDDVKDDEKGDEKKDDETTKPETDKKENDDVGAGSESKSEPPKPKPVYTLKMQNDNGAGIIEEEEEVPVKKSNDNVESKESEKEQEKENEKEKEKEKKEETKKDEAEKKNDDDKENSLEKMIQDEIVKQQSGKLTENENNDSAFVD